MIVESDSLVAIQTIGGNISLASQIKNLVKHISSQKLETILFCPLFYVRFGQYGCKKARLVVPKRFLNEYFLCFRKEKKKSKISNAFLVSREF